MSNKAYEWWQDPDLVASALHTEYLTSFKKPTPSRSKYHSFMLKLDTYRLVSHQLFVSVGCFGIIAAILLGVLTANYSPHISALAPPADPTISYCGARSGAEVERYNGAPSPRTPISVSEYPVGVLSNYHFTNVPTPRWSVLVGSTITTYDAQSKSVLSTFTVPGTVTGTQNFAVDDNGNFYFITQLTGFYKYDPAGNLLWHQTVAAPMDKTIYSYGNGANFRVAAEGRGLKGSYVFDTNGAAQTNNNVIGFPHYNETTNHIISIDGGFVRIYDATGMTQSFYIGTTLQPNDPGPFHFYVTAGAEDLPDGRLIVQDATGIMFFSSTGEYQGKLLNDTFVHGTGAIQFAQRGRPMYVYNSKIYYANDVYNSYAAGISSVGLDTAAAVLATPDGKPTGMGIGAGPFTNAPNSYFPTGTPPAIYLQFYPWWSQNGAGLTGYYKIRSASQVKANVDVPAVNYSVNIDPAAVTNIPIAVPSTDPGFYEMDVKLMRNGTIVGSSCLRYSIGAPGQTLSGITGTADAPTIKYSHATAQKLLRGSAFKIDNFIPNGDASSVAPEVFPTAIDTAVQADAAAAASEGVVYEIQIADGSPLEKSLVSNGKWGARVQEMVNHFKPWIHTWEAWNEPNNTYGGATQFTDNILKPFYTGVKAADPTATVVGGGILGVSQSYWSGIIADGGLGYMDVAGDHPYTGHNRSFEEQDQVTQLKSLQAMFAAAGKPNMEIYDTESGFWQSGSASFWAQGDKEVRKNILEQSIGMYHLSNFQNNSCYNDGSVTWGDLCTIYSTGMIASAQLQTMTGDKHFVRFVDTGIPHSYAAEFATNNGDGNRVVVVWTEDFNATIVPEYGNEPVTVTDEFGKTTVDSPYQPVTVGGSVTYLAVPAGKTLTIHPQETYDADVALATTGATAVASSSANGTPVSNIIDGKVTMSGQGNNFDGGVSIWTQHYADTNPMVTVSFAQPITINRIYVASQGINSVQTGLRSYDVQIDTGDGTFNTVASVRNDFYNRTHTVSFTAQTAARIRITNMSVNYSGYGDGLPPGFWPDPVTYASDDVWIGQTTIYEVEAYAAGSVYTPPVPVTISPVSATPTPTAPVAATAAHSTIIAKPAAVAASTDSSVTTPPPPATTVANASAQKPSTLSEPPTARQIAEVKPKIIRTSRVKAIIGISSVAVLSAGLLYFGYEIYRHRRHALSVLPTNFTPMPGMHVG